MSRGQGLLDCYVGSMLLVLRHTEASKCQAPTIATECFAVQRDMAGQGGCSVRSSPLCAQSHAKQIRPESKSLGEPVRQETIVSLQERTHCRVPLVNALEAVCTAAHSAHKTVHARGARPYACS